MMLGYLSKAGLIVTEQDPHAARTKLIRLTEKGILAQNYCQRRLPIIEEQWREQYGSETIQSLRQTLEQMIGDHRSPESPLRQGLKLHPQGWRASLPEPETLPHYPLVLHRGGFPDGS
jgi:hypothetical protein